MKTPRRRACALTLLAAIGLGLIAFSLHRYRASRIIAEIPAARSSDMLNEVDDLESITTEVNAKAPAFASADFEGRTIRSIDFIGDKVVLLEFWSVFCASCIQEMPFLSEIYRKYKGDGLEVIGINTDFFGPERIKRFMDRLEPAPGYPIIHDRSQEIAKAFNVEALPVTVIIDSAGWIRMYHLGYKVSDRQFIENKVRKLIGKIERTDETVAPVNGKTPVTAAGRNLIAEGAPLPECILFRSDGVRVSLEQLRRGKPLVIFFWSLFCQPCRQEMPWLSREARELATERDVIFLSANIDSPRLGGAVREFLTKKPLSFTTVLDAQSEPPGSLAGSLGVSHTPTVIMADRAGKVRKVLIGGLSQDALRLHLETFLSGGPAALPAGKNPG